MSVSIGPACKLPRDALFHAMRATCQGYGGTGGTTLVFSAATYNPSTYELSLQLTGQGTPTSTHTADLYAPDFEGIYREFGADEPVWSGGRVVRNLLPHSEDYSDPNWAVGTATITTGITDPNGGNTAATVTATAVNQFFRHNNITTVIGNIYRTILWLKRRTGTGQVRVGDVDAGYTDITAELTTEWKRFTTPQTVETDTSGVVIPIYISDSGDEVDCAFVQIEDTTAETLHRTTTESPELVTNGTFDTDTDWTKGDGWTISGGKAVKDAIGGGQFNQAILSLVAGTQYLVSIDVEDYNSLLRIFLGSDSGDFLNITSTGHHEAIMTAQGDHDKIVIYAATNAAIIDNVTVKELIEVAPGEYIPTTTAPAQAVYANENGNTVTSNVITEAVGSPLTEQPWLQYYPAATNLIEDSRDLTGWANSGAPPSYYDRIGITGEPNTATYIEDDDAATADNRRYLVSITSDTTSVARAWFKKDTSSTGYSLVRSSLSGGTGKIADVYVDLSTGDISLQGSDAANVEAEIYSDGEWWKIVIAHTDTGTNATRNTYIYPNVGSVIGTIGVSGTGSIIVSNVEIHDNKTIAGVRGLGPIFTEGSSVTADRTVYQYDIANNDNAQGAWYFEWEPSFDKGDALNQLILLTSVLYLHSSQGEYTSYDGTTTAINTADYSKDDAHQLALAYGDSKRIINVDAVYGPEAAYDGSLPFTGYVMHNMTASAKIRNLKRYNLAYDAAKTQIDSDMVITLTGDDFDTPLVDGDGNELTG